MSGPQRRLRARSSRTAFRLSASARTSAKRRWASRTSSATLPRICWNRRCSSRARAPKRMSSKSSSSIMAGTIRSISGPGRCTRTWESFPISEWTRRVKGGGFYRRAVPRSGRRQERDGFAFGFREFLVGDLGDPRELRAEPIQRGRRFLVLLLGVVQMAADLQKRLFRPVPEPFQLAESFLDLPGVFLEFLSAQHHRDRREEGVKEPRRDREHPD